MMRFGGAGLCCVGREDDWELGGCDVVDHVCQSVSQSGSEW